MLTWLILVISLPLLAGMPPEADGTGLAAVQVTGIIDGDSLEVAQGGRSFQVRLWGIDAPEYDQDCADAAKTWLQRVTSNSTARLERKYTDRFGRTVAMVWVDETLLNEALIERGLAWVHVRYCNERICKSWRDIESQARAGRIGIWRNDKPIPPWQWKDRKSRHNSRRE
jgi:endonuclease YncB( thermonuclease family)